MNVILNNFIFILRGILKRIHVYIFMYSLVSVFVGRDYEKSKVCKDFTSLGKDNFQSLSLVLYSRKFSSGTFEEVKALVNEVVSLAEECCDVNAAPDCYDRRTTELSSKSCEHDAPFPKHPDTHKCCAQEGLERNLCMTALVHPPQLFPTYKEPSNEEICESFRKKPSGFNEKYLYEYSSSYGQAPLPLLVSYTKNYLSMVSTCCASSDIKACFATERFENKFLTLLTTLSDEACSNFAVNGMEKTRFSYIVEFSQKAPIADLEDIELVAESMTNVLSECCDSIIEDCMANGIAEYTVSACESLSGKEKEFKNCCEEKNRMNIFLCIYSMPAAQPSKLSDNPSNEKTCNTENTNKIEKYIFEQRRKPNIPEVFITRVHRLCVEALSQCCKNEKPQACLNSRKPLARSEIIPFLAKGEELCDDYSQLTLTEFKKR
uniref:Vitamin D-binding protein n=1 Tax=Monodelphis domestica TaxID=13616 RepID=F6VJ37_MONDO